VQGWRAALAADLATAPDLAGTTFRKTAASYRRRAGLVVSVPAGSSPSLAASWALTRAAAWAREEISVVHGVHAACPAEALAHDGSYLMAPLLGGKAGLAEQWSKAARLAGLGNDDADSTLPRLGNLTTVYDLGLLGRVAVGLYDPEPSDQAAAARALLEAVDQGDSAAADRAADYFARRLGLTGPHELPLAGQGNHARWLQRAEEMPYGALPLEGRVQLLRAAYPARGEDLDRALAIVGVGNYEFPEAVPCAYLTAAGALCANTTRSPDRWCGSCARRPAVSVATLPLIDVPPVAAPAYALTDATPLAEWTAFLRNELAKDQEPRAVLSNAYCDDGYTEMAAPIDPVTVQVTRRKGRIVAAFPLRLHPTGPGSWTHLSGRDGRAIADVLGQHVDPALLLAGRVAVRYERPVSDLATARWGDPSRTRRSSKDLEHATTPVPPSSARAVEVLESALREKYGAMRGLTVTTDRADRRGTRSQSENIQAPEISIRWTDGPRDIHAVTGRYDRDLLEVDWDRDVSPEAVGMVALAQHFGVYRDSWAGDTPEYLAGSVDHPDKWGGDAAEKHPEIDPAWAAKIARHLGDMSSNQDIRAFLRQEGALVGLSMVLGLDVPDGV